MAAKKRPVTKCGRPRTRRGVKLKPTTLGATDLRLAEPPPEVLALAGPSRPTAARCWPPTASRWAATRCCSPRCRSTRWSGRRSSATSPTATCAGSRWPWTRPAATSTPSSRCATAAGYLTPNGGHRLTALKELGAKAVLALRGARRRRSPTRSWPSTSRRPTTSARRRWRWAGCTATWPGTSDPKETELALEFEEAALVTLGFAYEERPRLSGGAYAPILRKVDGFLDRKLSAAARRAGAAGRRGAGLRRGGDGGGGPAQGAGASTRPYLKNFVVARVNPLRFMKGGAPPFDELFAPMTRRAAGMDPGKVKSEDVARSGGAAEGE